ncbi:hypothetical protein AB751O23_AQ_00030 [Chlamydiales bacterium SCGC AB-751-O23]|nr:hypothetical protein AB751O23_AQ_00030 [Chlamydiales bacterium SCGC AB-751-O23]
MSSSKKILLNSFAYTVLSLLQKPIVFIIVIINSTFLEVEDFAKIALLMSLIELFSRCYVLGLPSAGTRFTSTFENNSFEMHRLWSSLFLMVAGLSIAFFLFLLLTHQWILDPFIQGVDFYPHLVLAAFCSIFSAIYMLYQRQYQAKHKAKEFSITVLSFSLVYLLSILFFVAHLKMGSVGVLLGFIVSNALVALKAFVTNFRHKPMVFCSEKAVHALKYSLPLFPHTISAWFMNLVDRFFIYHFVGAEVGGFAIAFQVAMILDTLTTGVYQAFQPWFFSLFEKKQEDNEEVFKFTAFTATLYTFAGLLISSFSKEIFQLFLREEYHSAWRFVPILACAQVIRGNYLFYLTALSSKSTFKVSIITLATAGFNILLNYLLIPYIGIMGACLSALITQHFIGALCVITCKYTYGVSFKLRKVMGITYSFFILSILNLYPVDLSFWSYFFLKLGLISLITLFLAYFYKAQIKRVYLKFMKKSSPSV